MEKGQAKGAEGDTALRQLRAFEVRLRHGAYAGVVWLCEVLIGGIGHVKIRYRPGRVEPRAIKRRSKNIAHLVQPRAVIKAQLQAQRELIMAAVYALVSAIGVASPLRHPGAHGLRFLPGVAWRMSQLVLLLDINF